MKTEIRKVMWAYKSTQRVHAELVVMQNGHRRTIDLGSYETEDTARHSANVACGSLVLVLLSAGVEDIALNDRVTFHDFRESA